MLRSKLIRFWPLAVLLLLFAVSVLVRWQSFGIDPAANARWTEFQRYNNTEVYLHDRYVLDVYSTHPASEHLFAGYVGSGSGDFLLNKQDPKLTVYTSFPPTHFIVLYVALKALHLGFTFLAMQIFSLSIHLLCVLLIYYLCRQLTRDRLLAVLGASIYIFSTGTLQYHMNVYWAHELLQPLFIASLIVFVKRKGLMRWWQSLGFGFAMSLITWTGAVASAGYALYGGYKYLTTKNRAYLGYLFALLGMAIALALIAAQALLATGANIPQYLGAVSHRVQVRSGATDHVTLAAMVWRFVNDLFLDYGGYFVIAFALAIRRKLKPFEWELLFVASFPIVESFALMQHDSMYGFGRLKWLLPAILVIVLFANRYVKTTKARVLLALVVGLADVVHAWLYLSVF